MPGINGVPGGKLPPSTAGTPSVVTADAAPAAGAVATPAADAGGPSGAGGAGAAAGADVLVPAGAAAAHKQAHKALGSTKGAGGDHAPPPGPLGALPRLGNLFATRLAALRGANASSPAAPALSEAERVLRAFQDALHAGRVPTALPLERLHDLPIPPAGLVLQLDAASVAGQRVVVRRFVDPEQGPGLEFEFKLRGDADIAAVADRMKAAGALEGTWEVSARRQDEEGRYVINPDVSPVTYPGKATQAYHSSTSTTAGVALSWESGADSRVRLLTGESAQAVSGLVQVCVFEGDDAAQMGARMRAALATTGLEPALAASQEESRALLAQLRVLWQRDPEKAQGFAERPLDPALDGAAVAEALRASGVDPDAAAQLATREVFPGHFTVIDPTQGERYRALGVEYLFAGVRKLESVVAILQGDGLMSTRERYARGMLIPGASSQADLCSGGADYAFTRMVTRDAKGKALSSAFGAGDYQLVYGTEVLDRTDWFAYNRDNFGVTRDLEKFGGRKYGEELVESLKNGAIGGYATSNEVMFQSGIGNQYISNIFTDSEEKKSALVQALHEAGVLHLGEKTIEEAIQVRKQMILDDGVSP